MRVVWACFSTERPNLFRVEQTFTEPRASQSFTNHVRVACQNLDPRGSRKHDKDSARCIATSSDKLLPQWATTHAGGKPQPQKQALNSNLTSCVQTLSQYLRGEVQVKGPGQANKVGGVGPPLRAIPPERRVHRLFHSTFPLFSSATLFFLAWLWPPFPGRVGGPWLPASQESPGGCGGLLRCLSSSALRDAGVAGGSRARAAAVVGEGQEMQVLGSEARLRCGGVSEGLLLFFFFLCLCPCGGGGGLFFGG